MRLLLITSTLSSGVRTHIKYLSNNLVSCTYGVTVIYSKRDDTKDEGLEDFDKRIRFYEVPLPRHVSWASDLEAWQKYREIIASVKPDVLYLHSSKAGAIGRLASIGAVRRGTKIFYTPHGYSFLRRDLPIPVRWLLWGAEFFLARFSETIAVSRNERAWARTFYINGSKVHLMLNGLPRSKRVVTRDVVKCIATSGRITTQKDPELFLEIASGIVKTFPFIKFLWIGGGTSQAERDFSRLIHEKGLDSSVFVTGWMSRIKALNVLQNEVDIYVHTSKWEGLSFSLLEAMVMGLPCVVSNIPANRELVQHGLHGYVASSANEFVAGIERLCLRSSERRKFGLLSARIIRLEYSWRNSFRTFLSVCGKNDA